jgi:hypothetical protein
MLQCIFITLYVLCLSAAYIEVLAHRPRLSITKLSAALAYRQNFGAMTLQNFFQPSLATSRPAIPMSCTASSRVDSRVSLLYYPFLSLHDDKISHIGPLLRSIHLSALWWSMLHPLLKDYNGI